MWNRLCCTRWQMATKQWTLEIEDLRWSTHRTPARWWFHEKRLRPFWQLHVFFSWFICFQINRKNINDREIISVFLSVLVTCGNDQAAAHNTFYTFFQLPALSVSDTKWPHNNRTCIGRNQWNKNRILKATKRASVPTNRTDGFFFNETEGNVRDIYFISILYRTIGKIENKKINISYTQLLKCQ